MDTETRDTYELDDVLVTAFLLTKGVNLINVVENRPNHFKFILSDPQKCHQLRIEYLNNASAPARELFSQREMLITEMKTRNGKGEIHGQQN